MAAPAQFSWKQLLGWQSLVARLPWNSPSIQCAASPVRWSRMGMPTQTRHFPASR